MFYLRKMEISEVSVIWFCHLYWNRKLRKSGNFSITCKFQRRCFIWGNEKFPRFPTFRFWVLILDFRYWNRKVGKLVNFAFSEFVFFKKVRKQIKMKIKIEIELTSNISYFTFPKWGKGLKLKFLNYKLCFGTRCGFFFRLYKLTCEVLLFNIDQI